jgi:hypothetical protein
MIFSGVFDRYPKLKVLFVHMGGALAPVICRLDWNWELNYDGIANPPIQKVDKNVRKPSEYFKSNIYVDCMGPSAIALKAMIETCGIDRVLFGSDFGPVPMSPKLHVDLIDDTIADARIVKRFSPPMRLRCCVCLQAHLASHTKLLSLHGRAPGNYVELPRGNALSSLSALAVISCCRMLRIEAQALHLRWSSENLPIVHSQVNDLKHTPRGLHDQRTVTYAIALAAVGELLELIESSAGKP